MAIAGEVFGFGNNALKTVKTIAIVGCIIFILLFIAYAFAKARAVGRDLGDDKKEKDKSISSTDGVDVALKTGVPVDS